MPQLTINGVYPGTDVGKKQLEEQLSFDFSSTLTDDFKTDLKVKVSAGSKGEDLYYELRGVTRRQIEPVISPEFKVIAQTRRGVIVENAGNVADARGYFKNLTAQAGFDRIDVSALSMDLYVSNPDYVTDQATEAINRDIHIPVEKVNLLQLNVETPLEFKVKLNNMNTGPERIKAGTYTSRLVLTGDYLQPAYLTVRVKVAEKTFREKLYRILFGEK